MASDYEEKYTEQEWISVLQDRLAAYEDSGLEPEEVLPKDKADEIALKLMRLADLESLCNYTRLRELAEADKDRRSVVHGRWGTGRFNLETGNYEEQCTQCRNFSKEYGKPYCPNCGAKMNEEEAVYD